MQQFIPSEAIGTAGFVAEDDDAAFVVGEVDEHRLKPTPPTHMKVELETCGVVVYPPAKTVVGTAFFVGIVGL